MITIYIVILIAGGVKLAPRSVQSRFSFSSVRPRPFYKYDFNR